MWKNEIVSGFRMPALSRSLVKSLVRAVAFLIHVMQGSHYNRVTLDMNHLPILVSCDAYCLSHELFT